MEVSQLNTSNIYYESLVARIGIIPVLILNTRSVNNARRGSIILSPVE